MSNLYLHHALDPTDRNPRHLLMGVRQAVAVYVHVHTHIFVLVLDVVELALEYAFSRLHDVLVLPQGGAGLWHGRALLERRYSQHPVQTWGLTISTNCWISLRIGYRLSCCVYVSE